MGIEKWIRHRELHASMDRLSRASGWSLVLIDPNGKVISPATPPTDGPCAAFRSSRDGRPRCSAAGCEKPSVGPALAHCHAGYAYAVSPVLSAGAPVATLAAHPLGLQAGRSSAGLMDYAASLGVSRSPDSFTLPVLPGSDEPAALGRLTGLADLLSLQVEHMRKLRDLSYEILLGYEEKEILSEMGTLAVSSAQVDDLAQQCLSRLCKVTRAGRGLFYHRPNPGNPYHLIAAFGEFNPPPPSEAREGSGLVGRALESGSPILLDSVGETGSGPLHDPESYLQGSVLAVPLKVGEETIGAVAFTGKPDASPFTTYDLKLVGTVCTQVGLAIKNGRLVGEIVSKEVEKQKIKGLFGRYLPPQVVDLLVQHDDPNQFPAIRDTLTILFGDIRGFTPLCEKESSDVIAAFLNDYFLAASRSIFKHEGTIDKFIGDSVMAFFGAPIKHDPKEGPADVERAIRVALDMRDSYDDIKARWVRKLPGIERTGLGIGVNTGPVVVGNIGSDFRMDYTVIGDAVNLASRLCSIAQHNQIVIGEATRNALGSKVQARPLTPVEIKGKTGKLNVFEVERLE